jgi:hypothetical protein
MKVKHLKEILKQYDDDCDIVLSIFESESAFDEHKDFLMSNKKDWSDKRRTAGILVDVGDIYFLGEHWISLVAIDKILEEKDLTSDRILLDGDVE